MGHAGAFQLPGEQSPESKAKALEDAGAKIVTHPTHFPAALKEAFKESGRDISKIVNFTQQQQTRGYHTMHRRAHTSSRRPTLQPTTTYSPAQAPAQQRNLGISSDKGKKLLESRGIDTNGSAQSQSDKRFVALTIDRTNRCPGILACPTANPSQIVTRSKLVPFDYKNGPTDETIRTAFEGLDMDAGPPAAQAELRKLVGVLFDLFKEKEAFALGVDFSVSDDAKLVIHRTDFGFDNSAFKSAKRQEDIQELRDVAAEDPAEVEAEKDGIVYVKLDDPSANVATLINGAGLAMNANDALISLGARPTNFLDTGGKATSDTIKKCFELLLRDERAKVIFVNIFGGLTLCDMIAEGVMMAFKELKMSVPVVVRLRGTNEEKGQKMVRTLDL